MTTATLTRRTATILTCKNCLKPATDDQNLVREIGGYVHPNCSARAAEYVQVIEVNIPSGQELGVITPAPAASGPVLCDDCTGASEPSDICPACQQIINDWESDHAPDYDVLYERYLSARDYLLVAA